jgi:transcriptional regulator with XRE-family HTH domain
MQGLRMRPIDVARQLTREQATRFGREIRTARVTTGISQQALARRSGVSQGFISMVERGRRVPGLEAANRLATACGLQFWLRLFPAEGVTLRDSGQLAMATATSRRPTLPTDAGWRSRSASPAIAARTTS